MSVVKLFNGNGDGSDGKTEVTMSSRDIAAIYEKPHRNVLRKIRELESAYIEVFGGRLKFEQSSYTNAQNKEQPEILLNKSQALFVSARFDPILHARVQKRWEDLEEEALAVANRLPDFTDDVLMAKLYIENREREKADEQEKLQLTHENRQLIHEVTNLKPKAAGFDTIAKSKGSLCMRDAAKMLRMRPMDLRDYMKYTGWIYQRNGKGPWIGRSDKCNQLLLDHIPAKDVEVREGVYRDFGNLVITKLGLAKLSLEAHVVDPSLLEE